MFGESVSVTMKLTSDVQPFAVTVPVAVPNVAISVPPKAVSTTDVVLRSVR